MNSNTRQNNSNHPSFSTPTIPASEHLVLRLPTIIYNPTIADFERLNRQYAQYFFFLLDQQRNYPRSPT